MDVTDSLAMVEMNFNNMLRDIRNRSFYPVYCLMGEEGFYIDVIAAFLEKHVLNDEEKEFNLSIFYGRDTDVPAITSTARRYPMMASHNVVIVREAQHLTGIDDLVPYLESPLKSTILVVCYKYKTLDRRTKLYKAFDKSGLVFTGKKLFDNQVPGWISSYVKQRGYQIGPTALQMLADHLGTDLGKIVNEVKKIFINIRKGEEITTTVIEENIGISKEFNIFEYQSAIGTKNKLKAYRIAQYFADNPKSNSIIRTTAVLCQFFSRILLYHGLNDKSRQNVAKKLGVAPYFVKNYEQAAKNYPPARIVQLFSLLRDYDMRSKGMNNVSTNEGELVRELTCRILH